jgi:hypothetical protein
MSDASVFRHFAEEAMCGSSKTTNEAYKRALEDLACTWAQAALASERVFGSSFASSPSDAGAATSSIHS